MKSILLSFSVVIFAASHLFAQRKDATFYWVVESNILLKDHSIIRFYDFDNTKVYEIALAGEYIDVRQRKQRRRLNRMVKEFSEGSVSFSSSSHQKETARFVQGYLQTTKPQFLLQHPQIDPDLLLSYRHVELRAPH